MADGELGKSYMINSIKTSSVKRRRKFDETFKREAVQNWLNSGKSAEVVAEELGTFFLKKGMPVTVEHRDLHRE